MADAWMLQKAEEFANAHPPGTTMTAKDLGQWFIQNQFFNAPTSSKKSSPEWIMYVRERQIARDQINRAARSKAFIQTHNICYEIQYDSKTKRYHVLNLFDNTRELMDKFIRALTTWSENKLYKVNSVRQKAIDENNLTVAQIEFLDNLGNNLVAFQGVFNGAAVMLSGLYQSLENDLNRAAAQGLWPNNGNSGSPASAAPPTPPVPKTP